MVVEACPRNHWCQRNGLRAVSHLREAGSEHPLRRKEGRGAHPLCAPAGGKPLAKEAKVGRSVSRRNPFSFLFARTEREQYLERYVLREYRKGRPFAEILEDPYLRAWSTPEERARLLERPNVVSAIGEHAIADLKRHSAPAGSASRASHPKNRPEDGAAHPLA
jgi:hypothetical protein